MFFLRCRCIAKIAQWLSKAYFPKGETFYVTLDFLTHLRSIDYHTFEPQDAQKY
jgi:hypothetical protein